MYMYTCTVHIHSQHSHVYIAIWDASALLQPYITANTCTAENILYMHIVILACTVYT